MILTNKPDIEGKTIKEELGLVGGSIVNSRFFIRDFLDKKKKREEEKDGKKDSAQEDIPEEEEQSVKAVPGDVEESQEEEIEARPTQPATDTKITFTKSFNIPVNGKNMETTKKILDDNIQNGFVIAFQAGTYVDKNNVERIKKALKYFVDNDYKVIIATENVQEIPDGTKWVWKNF